MADDKPLVSLNMKFVRGPWGGSSPFVIQLSSILKAWGCRVCYDLRPGVAVIVLIDPRKASNKPYGVEEIRAYKEQNPDVKVLHRVNECDGRKNTDFMDDLLEEASSVADWTVFISEWLMEYFSERWFDPSRPHSMIYNGADPRIYYPRARRGLASNRPMRLVTHHWSNHWMKGFDVYQEVDRMIADGELPNTELMVVGRWPEEITWRSAITHPPCTGHKLARLLRTGDVYLTASKREPCGMHHVEGAQCGLPLLYHEDGGGINEAGRRYGLGFTDDLKQAIETMRNQFEHYYTLVLKQMPDGDAMARGYAAAILKLISEAT